MGNALSKHVGGRPLDLITCPLVNFSAAVLDAAAHLGTAPTERFGARKAFISALFRALAQAGHDVGSLDSFKARLLDCLVAGHLVLARADLVAAMPRATVAASEIRDRGSEFHFVLDPAAREAWEVAS